MSLPRNSEGTGYCPHCAHDLFDYLDLSPVARRTLTAVFDYMDEGFTVLEAIDKLDELRLFSPERYEPYDLEALDNELPE